jgi:hypothetical protein
MSDTYVGTRFVCSLSMIAKPEADTGVEKTSESGVYSHPRKSPAAERGALDG